MLLLRLIDRCYPVSNVEGLLKIKKCKSLIFIVLKDNIWEMEWAKPQLRTCRYWGLDSL